MLIPKQKTEASRWGLPLEEIEQLGERLRDNYDKFRPYLRTQTHDTSSYGLHYLNGLLRMERSRNIANIGRKTDMPKQNLQHFISNSPWSSGALIDGIQADVGAHAEFQSGAVLVLDESADEKAGEHSAGAGRQHNGRLGKIEMSQVGVFLSLVTPRVNTWVDGALYLPERWFSDNYAQQRTKVGLPETIHFQTKPQLGLEMIKRARANGLPFEAVAMDDLYGRNNTLRSELNAANIEYYGDILANTRVYLDQPEVVYSLTKHGKPRKHPRIQGARPYEVRQLLQHSDLERAHITLRPNERGFLRAEFARLPVWTIHKNLPRQEWLLIRQDANRTTYVLSNASQDNSLASMARRKSHRYFIERSNQDAKTELGWDEFQAIKYHAWQHHLALTILASWFVADTRLDWMTRFQRDPGLFEQYQTEVLPSLSVANVRELLRAAMPLPQLSSQAAANLVVEHLVNRTRSRQSRLRSRHQPIAET